MKHEEKSFDRDRLAGDYLEIINARVHDKDTEE